MTTNTRVEFWMAMHVVTLIHFEWREAESGFSSNHGGRRNSAQLFISAAITHKALTPFVS